MTSTFNGIMNLKPVALNGVAKTSLLSQHNLMPQHSGKSLKKCLPKILRNLGVMELDFVDKNLGTLNYNVSHNDTFVFVKACLKTPSDILTSYRKTDDGTSFLPYAMQLNLVYHLKNDFKTYLLVRIPICVTAESGQGLNKYMYQKFFNQLSRFRENGDKEMKIGEGGMTLNDLYPLHGDDDKVEMTFFTNEYPRERLKDIGINELENLHVITFKNSLEIHCNVANRLVKKILGYEMGDCDANLDDRCAQVNLSNKFSKIISHASLNYIDAKKNGVDIYAVTLRLSPDEYKRLEKKSSKIMEGSDDEMEQFNDGKKEEDTEKKGENSETTGEDSEKKVDNGEKDGDEDEDEGDKLKVKFNYTFILIWGIAFFISLCAVFYFWYLKGANSFGNAWSSLMNDISSTVSSLMGVVISIGTGKSVMGLQLMRTNNDLNSVRIGSVNSGSMGNETVGNETVGSLRSNRPSVPMTSAGLASSGASSNNVLHSPSTSSMTKSLAQQIRTMSGNSKKKDILLDKLSSLFKNIKNTEQQLGKTLSVVRSI